MPGGGCVAAMVRSVPLAALDLTCSLDFILPWAWRKEVRGEGWQRVVMIVVHRRFRSPLKFEGVTDLNATAECEFCMYQCSVCTYIHIVQYLVCPHTLMRHVDTAVDRDTTVVRFVWYHMS